MLFTDLKGLLNLPLLSALKDGFYVILTLERIT
jgi:hypothetical protein